MDRRIVLGAVGLLAFADVVLVGFAINHANTVTPSSNAAPTIEATSESEISATTSSSTSSSQPSAPSATALISLAPDGTIIRGSGQHCTAGQPATVEISTDDGATFVPVSQGVTQVLRVIARSAANLSFVGTDSACTPTLYQSVDGGQTWTPGQLDGAWYFTAGDTASITSPVGENTPSCEPIALSVLSKDIAYVGCQDGSVTLSSDGGATWTPRGSTAGLTSLAFVNNTRGYAIATGPQCPVEVQVTDDQGASWTPVGCIQGAQQGEAIDAVGQQIVAQVDGQFRSSSDGGATWS